MPVYHFTIHAYRSWGPEHPRGYTKKGEGYRPTDSELGFQYDQNAAQPPVTFDERTQKQILVLTHEICAREKWRFEAAGFDPTHTHLVLIWKDFVKWEEVDRRLKNLLALKLNRLNASPAKRWFARRHGCPRRVRDQSHLDYLLQTYLPDHPGIFWKRGMTLPTL